MLQNLKHTAALTVRRSAGLFILGFIIFFVSAQLGLAVAQARARSYRATLATPAADADIGLAPVTQADAGDSTLRRLFSSRPEELVTQGNWYWRMAVIALRFLLAALLASVLAFRPRKELPVTQRNPFVAQTQMLVAIVGAAMMMVVADSVARAFGIFAAASIVRFRTNIRDPKEITVLLICLALGLAAGVGGLEISITLTLFTLLALWVLERFEPEQVMRALELKVKTRDVEKTDESLKKIFKNYRLNAELRKLDREDEKNSLGTIQYFVSGSSAISTDQLSAEIFSAGADDVDSVDWEHKRSGAYLYR